MHPMTSSSSMQALPVNSPTSILKKQKRETGKAGTTCSTMYPVLYKNMVTSCIPAPTLLTFFRIKEIRVIFLVCKGWRDITKLCAVPSFQIRVESHHLQMSKLFNIWNTRMTLKDAEVDHARGPTANEQEKKVRQNNLATLRQERDKKIGEYYKLQSAIKDYKNLNGISTITTLLKSRYHEWTDSIKISAILASELPEETILYLIEERLIARFQNHSSFRFSQCSFSNRGFNILCSFLRNLPNKLTGEEFRNLPNKLTRKEIRDWINKNGEIFIHHIKVDEKPLSDKHIKMLLEAFDVLLTDKTPQSDETPQADKTPQSISILSIRGSVFSELDAVADFCSKYRVETLSLVSNKLSYGCIQTIASILANKNSSVRSINLINTADENFLDDIAFELLLAGVRRMGSQNLSVMRLPLSQSERQADIIEELRNIHRLKVMHE